MAITKSELIDKLQKKHPELSYQEVESAVGIILNEISDALVDGNRVELRGFGAFSTRERDARVARNPKNGETVKVDKRFSIYFRAGKELREKLNDDAS